MSDYTPPFSVSAKAIRLVAGISALVERCAIRLEKDVPSISAKEIADKRGITPRQIEKYLSEMKKKGIIQRMGARRNGVWKICSPE